MDIQAALEVARVFAGMARRANMFDHDRVDIILELENMAVNYSRIAEQMEMQMEQQMEMQMEQQMGVAHNGA